MNLTPEERRRVYEEEKIRLESEVKEKQATRRSWTLFLVIIFTFLTGIGSIIYLFKVRKAPTVASSGQQSSQNSETSKTKGRESQDESKASAESKTRLEKAEYGFNAEDGCRDLYYRIRGDGGQNPEAIARNMQGVDKTITYNRIMKNPAPFYGQPIVINGRVMQIMEYPADDGGFFTDAFIYWGSDLVTISMVGQTPFVKGDRVTVVGYLANHLYQYKSISQWDMAVPLVVARAILKPSEAARIKTTKAISEK